MSQYNPASPQPSMFLMSDAMVEDDLSDADIDGQAETRRPLTQSVRELIDAVVRTEVDADEIAAVRAEVDALTARLRAHQLAGSYGVRFNASGKPRNWGNAVVGIRNPIAPPLDIQHEDDGRVWAEVVLGAAYEGPPGLVHGGVTALLLDQVLGEGAAAAKAPGMTGTLTLRYLVGAPLGPIRVEAKADRVEGAKTFVEGALYALPAADAGDSEPTLCARAEGIFILPRWARELMAAQEEDGQA